MGRMMANLLIGKLDGKKWHPPHLISVKALEKVDSGTMARFVNEGLVRDEFAQVDKLISKTKQVFLKAPQRLSVYREMCPGLSIAPRPVLTRWTTWITAVSFYWEHFEALKAVVNSFNSDDAVCIKECQLTFNNSVWQDLAYIHSNFGQLATAITKLETQGMTIFDAMDVFAGVHNQMDNVYGEKANEIRKKFADIVAKNHGIEKQRLEPPPLSEFGGTGAADLEAEDRDSKIWMLCRSKLEPESRSKLEEVFSELTGGAQPNIGAIAGQHQLPPVLHLPFGGGGGPADQEVEDRLLPAKKGSKMWTLGRSKLEAEGRSKLEAERRSKLEALGRSKMLARAAERRSRR
ncbi:hypothetical protein niasHT_032070 [Heterodera trifolii]|uniref:Uncharacterized protein n=1 Tax=Heterodera trifolii TaxID=157864 RepID=A0ABD2I9U1_9BILA